MANTKIIERTPDVSVTYVDDVQNALLICRRGGAPTCFCENKSMTRP